MGQGLIRHSLVGGWWLVVGSYLVDTYLGT